MNTKYIFVTGGVVSGLGKGITAASLGRLLKARGYKVIIQKFDPYINIDPGTMSPIQHGEVFVTEDGGETDLDLGHYERFIDENLTGLSSVTQGKIFKSVLTKERNGEYKGATVQVIPHITNEIKGNVYKAGKESNADIVITEVGGTVGDIESLPFLEGIRQVKHELGSENVLYMHVTLIPYIQASGEIKTKPTQHSVRELREIGIQPDILVCRTEVELTDDTLDKLALFCNVNKESVFMNMNADTLYAVPLMLEEQKMASVVLNKLNLRDTTPDLIEWTSIVNKQRAIKHTTKIALVGKYIELKDAYLSVIEALNHAGIHNDTNIDINWILADDLLDDKNMKLLDGHDGILVPGGYGLRGFNGKVKAIQYARENNIPFLGICLGMQSSAVEFARNVVGLKDAHSEEFKEEVPNQTSIINYINNELKDFSTTQRLGAYDCKITEGTLAHEIYGTTMISERHRHRLEFNNEYKKLLEQHGMIFSGTNPQTGLAEIVELPRDTHQFFIAGQFHPEFASRPNRPHPLFYHFVKTAKNS